MNTHKRPHIIFYSPFTDKNKFPAKIKSTKIQDFRMCLGDIVKFNGSVWIQCRGCSA